MTDLFTDMADASVVDHKNEEIGFFASHKAAEKAIITVGRSDSNPTFGGLEIL